MFLSEIFIMAFIIFGEASGESYTGKLGVASAIRNRVESWGRTYYDVMMEPRQFSCLNKSEINKHIERVTFEGFYECFTIAFCMRFNLMEPIVRSKFYVVSGTKRDWMKEMVTEVTIDNHEYMDYRNDK